MKVATKVCVHFGVCGGCAHQDIAYEEQLRIKQERVHTFLQDFRIAEFHSIQRSPETNFYRNKMEYSFCDERDIAILNGQDIRHSSAVTRHSAHIGLHPKGRFALVTPTAECLLLSPESQCVLALVSE